MIQIIKQLYLRLLTFIIPILLNQKTFIFTYDNLSN